MNRLADKRVACGFCETAMVTGIARWPAATSKMGAAWGERGLTANKRATLLCSSKSIGHEIDDNPKCKSDTTLAAILDEGVRREPMPTEENDLKSRRNSTGSQLRWMHSGSGRSD